MLSPSEDVFVELAARGNLIPLVREILADFDTPLSLFHRLDDGRTSLLLESVQGREVGALELHRRGATRSFAPAVPTSSGSKAVASSAHASPVIRWSCSVSVWPECASHNQRGSSYRRSSAAPWA